MTRLSKLPFKPCLLPSTLDFGAVHPGNKVGDIAGVCNWPRSGQVTATITNDNSGGLFTGFTLAVYDVELSDSGGGGPRPTIPRPQWQLVEVATGNGSQPLPVAPGQTVGVSLFFTAPGQATGKPFTATIHILSAGAVAATIPVTAMVEAPDVSVNWTLANPFGIEIKSLSTTDPLTGVFHAGHVNDVLALGGQHGGAPLVGTDAAGVWLLQLPGSSISPPATHLTDNWDSNQVTCLCQGPYGPDHVYAGTAQTGGMPGVLYETEDLTNWRTISPPGAGTIYKIVVTNGAPRRIVVAASGGVFWSSIPQPGGSYDPWKQPIGLPPGGYSGLALGPNDRIVVAAWGANVATKHYGIFYGDWPGGLTMSRSQLPAQTPGQGMGRTSLASSPQKPSVMYGVSANLKDGSIYAILTSSKGGETWTQLPFPPTNTSTGDPIPYNQGDYNNCISVSPYDSSVVALGWQKLIVSRKGAQTWQVFDNHYSPPANHPDPHPELHDDVHAVYFDPSDPPNERLYVCSDGGVVLTTDKGKTFDSSLNRYLATLECCATIPSRNFHGSLSVQGNFLASGLQDNGNVYCALKTTTSISAPVSPWVQVADGQGDGGWVALIATGQLITDGIKNDGTWFCDAFQLRSSIPFDCDLEQPLAFDVPVPVAVPAAGIWAMEPVLAPTKMYAVATSKDGQIVYGLFYDQGNLGWHEVGWVTAGSISALATLDDGASALVGTDASALFLVKPSRANPTAGQKLSVTLPPGTPRGAINRIVFPSATLAFAAFSFNGNGHILRFDGTAWTTADSGLPQGPFYGLARDGYGRTWTCTDDKVFVSRDDGFNWKDASNGLPRRPHCAELRYNFAQQNPPLLYLSTYGHSVWVTGVVD